MTTVYISLKWLYKLMMNGIQDLCIQGYLHSSAVARVQRVNLNPSLRVQRSLDAPQRGCSTIGAVGG